MLVNAYSSSWFLYILIFSKQYEPSGYKHFGNEIVVCPQYKKRTGKESRTNGFCTCLYQTWLVEWWIVMVNEFDKWFEWVVLDRYATWYIPTRPQTNLNLNMTFPFFLQLSPLPKQPSIPTTLNQQATVNHNTTSKLLNTWINVDCSNGND